MMARTAEIRNCHKYRIAFHRCNVLFEQMIGILPDFGCCVTKQYSNETHLLPARRGFGSGFVACAG